MRSKALKLNVLTSLLSELVVFICGLILPRLILLHYGSNGNGLVSSITQYLGFSVVLRAGVGAVTRAALYKPLAENDSLTVSRIMVATRSYMRKVGLILAAGILCFAFVYPIVIDEYKWSYAFFMVIVLGLTSFADNFFGIKNIILLQASQKYYIQTLSAILAQICSCVISIILINFNVDMLFVKLGATLGFMIKPIFLEIYVKRHFKLDYSVEANNGLIKQRWDAFAQQVAVIINNNIDIVLITLFSVLSEVSIYTVHYMVVNNIGKIAQASISGVDSTFGDIIAKKEHDNLLKVFSFIEWELFAICVIMFSVTATMITPFIDIYTRSVEDANYHQPLFAFLMTFVTMFNCFRVPYQCLVEASGHFKQTRNGAILEVIINLLVSIILLIKFGIIGVIIGTFAACIVRTVQYSLYAAKNILKISCFKVITKYFIYNMLFVVNYVFCSRYIVSDISNYWEWILLSVKVGAIAILSTTFISVLFNKNDVMYLLIRIKKRMKIAL